LRFLANGPAGQPLGVVLPGLELLFARLRISLAAMGLLGRAGPATRDQLRLQPQPRLAFLSGQFQSLRPLPGQLVDAALKSAFASRSSLLWFTLRCTRVRRRFAFSLRAR